ncbi:MAG: transmembrane domain-containing protein [Acutalibacteraceae bacterium]
MKKYSLLKKATAVATATTMLLSTAPLTAFAEEDTSSYIYYLYENTMTDEMTGITVTGNLPYDCRMNVYVNFLQGTTYTDLNDSDSGISTLDDIETGFPKLGGKPVTTMFNPLNWAESTKDIVNEDLIPQIHISFINDSTVLDFDSNLLVTVPYDFYKYYGATAENNQVAVFTNGYSEDDTKGLQVVDQERINKNSFTFKADAPGTFYIGKPDSLKSFATSLAVTPEEIEIPEKTGETKVIDVTGETHKGLTIETTNPRHLKASVQAPKEFAPFAHDIYDGNFTSLKEDYMQEMYYITMEEEDPGFMFSVERGEYDDLSKEEIENHYLRCFSTTTLDRKVKVSIPSDNKDLYVINVNNTFSPYQLDAEYIDGKYVFETDDLGYFMLSSQAIPEYKEPELTQQTITDEKTGITVSGLLPKNADIEFNVLTYSSYLYTDFMDADNAAGSFRHSRYSLPQPDKLYTNVDSTSEDYTEDVAWSSLTDEHIVNVQILFRDGFRLLDFSSDLTVTLPYGFEYALRENVKAYKINYHTNNINPVEVLQNEDKENFTFKTNSIGSYLLGIQSNIDYVLGDACGKIEEATEASTKNDTQNTEATAENTDNTTTEKDTATAPVSSTLFTILAIGGVILILAIGVVVILFKRRRR